MSDQPGRVQGLSLILDAALAAAGGLRPGDRAKIHIDGLGTIIVGLVPDATDAVKGKIEIATNTEADAGVATDKAVVPSNLPTAVPANMPDATDVIEGKTRYSTDVEALALTIDTAAITPGNLGAALGNFTEAKGTVTEVTSYATLEADFVAQRGRASRIGDVHISRDFSNSNFYLWVRTFANVWDGTALQGPAGNIEYVGP